MLLFSMLWTASNIPAPVPAVLLFMLSWIHSSPDKCMAAIAVQLKSLFASLPLSYAPAGSSGSNSWWQQQLKITAAACLPPPAQAATKMLQPTSNPAISLRRKVSLRHPSESESASGNASEDDTCSIQSWAYEPFICWISRWQYSQAPCSWCSSSSSRVPCGQDWKVNKPCQWLFDYHWQL